MTLPPPAPVHRVPRPGDALLLAVAAFTLFGLAVAWLTLKLNAHLAADLGDALLLVLYCVAGYGAAGVALGGAGAALVALVRRFAASPALARLAGVAVISVLGLAPLLYFLLLPDLGLGSRALTHFLSAPPWSQTLALALVTLGLVAAGLACGAGLTAAARRLKTTPRALLAALWLVSAAVLAFQCVGSRPAAADPAALAASPVTLPPPPAAAPPRVVLLCIDGADLDDVILPLAEAGDLPNFERLMREGTWGSLATITPTLSPSVWTTLITGKAPADHGIRHFLQFRLPGIHQSVDVFPLHTGLNFRFFPVLEKIPGLPAMRSPATSQMRRVEALWTILGRRYRVGSYRWLLTWPAEEVNGFSLAGGFGWVQFSPQDLAAQNRTFYPPDAGLWPGSPPPRPVPPEALAAYVGAGQQIDPQDERLRAIRITLRDATASELPRLIERFDVHFAASSFYSVDGYHHLFSTHRGRGGLFSDAIDERYRFVDARLGELLDALPQPTHVIVVSDHGYDFEHHHHTFAPPGIFFAHGPAFEAGRRLEGLSVYDVAPLVLHLLDMPLPDDMPGALSGAYRSALSRDFLDRHRVARVPTYEAPGTSRREDVESPRAEEIKEVLKTLGYIH